MGIADLFPDGLDLSPAGLSVGDAWDLLGPVALYIAGMGLFAMFVHKFCDFISARDMFELDLSRYEESPYRWVRRILHVIMYAAKYLIVFPAFAFFWFAVLTLLLSFLSDERPFADILLISLATVGAIRVTAYYSEDLSRDVAKILPFAVLSLFLLDASFLNVDDSMGILEETNVQRMSIVYYMLFLVSLEFVMQLGLGTFALLRGEGAPPPDDADEAEPGPPDEDDARRTPRGQPDRHPAARPPRALQDHPPPIASGSLSPRG